VNKYRIITLPINGALAADRLNENTDASPASLHVCRITNAVLATPSNAINTAMRHRLRTDNYCLTLTVSRRHSFLSFVSVWPTTLHWRLVQWRIWFQNFLWC